MKRSTFLDGYGTLKDRWFFPLAAGTILFITLVFLLGVRTVGKHYDHNACKQYALTTGRETRFVSYTFWQWDCLTPSRDGKWIPTKQLRSVR